MRFLLLVCLLALCPFLEAQTKNIFLTRDEVMSLPMTGGGWTGLKTAADQSPGTPDLSNQDSPENCRTLARALVYIRTGTESYKTKVVAALQKVPGTEIGGRTLALGRQLGAYILAADLIGYREPVFVQFVTSVRTETLDGSTLIKKHQEKANNWSQVIGWTLAIAALYVGDSVDLARTVNVFKGTLGDRASFAFPQSAFGELIWQSDPTKPVVVLPRSALIQGHVMSGALPEELRRASLSFRWPPPCENYTWSATEGIVGTAWVLWHSGTVPDIWDFQDKAVLRVVQWNHQQANCPATGNDTHLPHDVNVVYGTTFPAPSPSQHGKLFGFGDWWARVYKGITPPPPSVADLECTWKFFNDPTAPAALKWTCHRIVTGTDTDVPGVGSTTADALRAWLLLNPGEPN